MKRLHITALRGNGMTTEYRASETPHMGSGPWVPETVQAARLRRIADFIEEQVRVTRSHAKDSDMGRNNVTLIENATSHFLAAASELRALAQEDGE